LTTGHFNLQTARAATIPETNGRASVFLRSVSAGLVAFAIAAHRCRRPQLAAGEAGDRAGQDRHQQAGVGVPGWGRGRGLLPSRLGWIPTGLPQIGTFGPRRALAVSLPFGGEMEMASMSELKAPLGAHRCLAVHACCGPLTISGKDAGDV
jgi:hypothetical protein